MAEYNVGGGAAQLSVKQREFSIFTDFDGTNLSERTRWTRGQATSELQIFNANLKVNDILEFSTGNGVNIEGANIKSGDIKLTTYTSEPTLLFSGYAAFAKIGTQLFLYYKDGAALKRVELT
ncbi:MAG: hypothetical protein HYR55_11910 [Acidobacteria bacterium]|nr:hypothetical protein [Acidobacteriota bacterium]MBI3655872.1 hypothetical protein [Acidobacteriota bacterium]